MSVRRLLVVSAEEPFLRTASLSLSMVGGCRCDSARDSAAAQRMMNERGYCGLVLDLDEGDAAYLTLARLRARNFLTGSHIPVMLLSRIAPADVTRPIIETGPTRTFLKPVRVQDIAREVGFLLGGSQRHPAPEGSAFVKRS